MEHRLDEINCNSLKVVNSDGQVVASVGSDEDRNGKVVVFDRMGKRRVEVRGSGEIILFDETGSPKVSAGQNQREERFASVSSSDNRSGQTTQSNAPSVQNVGRFDLPTARRDRQSRRPTVKNPSPARNTRDSSGSELGIQPL